TARERDTPQKPETCVDAPLPASSELEVVPETPSPPVAEAAVIPDTPSPSMNEQVIALERSRPVEDEAIRDTVVVEEEDDAASVGAERAMPPVTVIVRPVARPPSQGRPLKRAAMLLAFLLFASSSLLLWQNVNQAHLFLYSLNAANGQTLAQEDLGGYASIGALS